MAGYVVAALWLKWEDGRERRECLDRAHRRAVLLQAYRAGNGSPEAAWESGYEPDPWEHGRLVAPLIRKCPGGEAEE